MRLLLAEYGTIVSINLPTPINVTLPESFVDIIFHEGEIVSFLHMNLEVLPLDSLVFTNR